MAELYCKGCGALLQQENKTLPGYVSENINLHDETKPVLCQRCFRLRHYSDAITYSLSNDEYATVINRIKNENALIVKVVDIFDYSGSFVPAIKHLPGRSHSRRQQDGSSTEKCKRRKDYHLAQTNVGHGGLHRLGQHSDFRQIR